MSKNDGGTEVVLSINAQDNSQSAFDSVNNSTAKLEKNVGGLSKRISNARESAGALRLIFDTISEGADFLDKLFHNFDEIIEKAINVGEALTEIVKLTP